MGDAESRGFSNIYRIHGSLSTPSASTYTARTRTTASNQPVHAASTHGQQTANTRTNHISGARRRRRPTRPSATLGCYGCTQQRRELPVASKWRLHACTLGGSMRRPRCWLLDPQSPPGASRTLASKLAGRWMDPIASLWLTERVDRLDDGT